LAPAALLPDQPLTRGVLPWQVLGALLANVLVDFAGPLAAEEPTPVARSLLSATVTWLPALVAGAVVQTTARAARGMAWTSSEKPARTLSMVVGVGAFSMVDTLWPRRHPKWFTFPLGAAASSLAIELRATDFTG
jgi:hypothetical protein